MEVKIYTCSATFPMSNSADQNDENLQKHSDGSSSGNQAPFVEDEERFRRMTDDLPVLIWMSDAEKSHSHFNRSWLNFTSRTLDQELGNGWTQGVHPDDLQNCLAIYCGAFDNRQPFTIEYRLRRSDGQYRWITVTGIPRAFPDGTFAGYVGCCLDVSDRREAEEARRQLSDRLIRSQEAERTRIARELHDDIGQSLAILCVQMQRANKPISGVPGKTHPGLPALTDAVDKIAKKVSQISHELHSSELEYLGLKVALQSACRAFADRRHINVSFVCDRVPAKVEGIVGLCFLRIVQEALHNIDKHSSAQNVEVRLAGNGGNLSLEISDDGQGFDVEEARMAAGLGLISMRERMHLVNGEFQLDSHPGKGTRIRVRAPINAASMSQTAKSSS